MSSAGDKKGIPPDRKGGSLEHDHRNSRRLRDSSAKKKKEDKWAKRVREKVDLGRARRSVEHDNVQRKSRGKEM